MNERLNELLKLEAQYRTVAPNGSDHKKVMEQITELRNTMSSPAVPTINDTINDIKTKADNQRKNISWFYDKAMTSTGINKASSFTFGSSADKGVPLQIQKQNLAKLNADIANNVNSLASAKLDRIGTLDTNTNQNISNLLQLDANAKQQERAQALQEQQLAISKKNAEDTLAESKRQFDISAGIANKSAAAAGGTSTNASGTAATGANSQYSTANIEAAKKAQAQQAAIAGANVAIDAVNGVINNPAVIAANTASDAVKRIVKLPPKTEAEKQAEAKRAANTAVDAALQAVNRVWTPVYNNAGRYTSTPTVQDVSRLALANAVTAAGYKIITDERGRQGYFKDNKWYYI